MQQKGFTIIELIVVIAIIAVLASLVLSNVSQYISKGRTTAVTGNMASLLNNAAAYFDTNGSGTGANFCADSATGGALTGSIATAINNSQGSSFSCNGDSGSQAWCAIVTTPSAFDGTNTSYCIDSTGYKGQQMSGKCAGSIYTCQ